MSLPTHPIPTKKLIRQGNYLNAYVDERLWLSAPAAIAEQLLVERLISQGWEYLHPRILYGVESVA